MFDGKAFGAEIVSAVKAHIADSLKPVMDRIDAIERRLDEAPAPKEVDLDGLLAQAKAAGQEAVAAVESSLESFKPDPSEVKALLEDFVAQHVAAIPAPQDGKSVTLDDVAPLIEKAVSEAVSAIPAPKDGRDGIDGKDGRDGLDVKEMFRADGGRLIATMTDGTTRDLGVFVGKDGAPGRDGFNLEDFDATLMDDGRTVLLSFKRGDQVFKCELGIPTMIYRGVFNEGKKYERGDTVTFGGSLWHCDEETDAKPGEGQKAWTLAAKRGRDGKPGKDFTPPAPKQPIKLGGE
ncbi:hypothetical protein GCM10007908_03630 [Rhizobium albus]|nr:hypothetical protein GCM10007908_03630 [Rhizobium albus]